LCFADTQQAGCSTGCYDRIRNPLSACQTRWAEAGISSSMHMRRIIVATSARPIATDRDALAVNRMVQQQYVAASGLERIFDGQEANE
jgi:hypothetical protein